MTALTDALTLERSRARATAALAVRQTDESSYTGATVGPGIYTENSGVVSVHLDGDPPGQFVVVGFLGPWVPYSGQRCLVQNSRGTVVALGPAGPTPQRPWTPTVSGGTWALGNGTSTGWYERFGGWCYVHGIVTFGSTSNFGGGTGLTVGGLPIPPRPGQPTTLFLEYSIGAGPTINPGWSRIAAGLLTGAAVYGAVFAAPGNVFYGAVNATTPGTWQAGNSIVFEGHYPV